jgi:NAD(P)H-hydrate epimerase
MGDVLTGMISGFIAQGYAPAAAARIAVFLHGAAADELACELGPFGYLAGDVMARLPQIIGRLLSGSPPAAPMDCPLPIRELL